MTPFSKRIQADGSSRWWQADPGRYVDAQQYQLVDWLAAGGVPDATPYNAPPVIPPAPRQFSKLLIVNAIDGLGALPQFVAYRDSSLSLREKWAAAQYIVEDDPDFGSALPGFAASLGKSEVEIEALLSSCVYEP